MHHRAKRSRAAASSGVSAKRQLPVVLTGPIAAISIWRAQRRSAFIAGMLSQENNGMFILNYFREISIEHRLTWN
jgi:hypothetical protein